MSLTINSLELPGIMIIFFRFPCNFEIEVSPLIQTIPVSTKKITVEGMGFFFSISDKGWKRRKGKEKETCNRATTSNLALILTRVIFFEEPADAPYVLQPLKIISTVDLLSWLLYNKNWLQETGRHLSPVGEGEEFGRYRYYNGHNRCHKHKDCRANGCLAKSLLIDQ